MYQAHKDQTAFLFIYIHEAHPEDGWQLPLNQEDAVVFHRGKSWSERRSVAEQCSTRLNLTMPVVVDTMDNEVDELYAAWPERLFVIDRDGNIAYAGGQGPWGFIPAEAEKALKELL